MFNDTQNVIINGGTITNIEGDSFNIHGNLFYGDGEQGLQSLVRAASLGAIHDSSERYPPPSCHAETRLEVRRMISDWTKDQNTVSLMLWLHGTVGVGKSAIIQSIAEQLALEKGSLGASFFFSAGKADRNQGKFLVPTIAHQLALNVPELRIHINNAMVCNPTLHSKAIPVQMQHLIVEPFGKLAAPPQIVPTVLVDGLDECQNHDIQRLIVTLIGEALIKFKLPIRFVIASRPEAHIREAFDTTRLRSITHRIPLDESFQASRDIKKYLEDGFRDIQERKAHVMAQASTPWPGEGILDLLVQKASGQFIYAATVLKFVGAEYCRPTSQLAIVLQPRPSSAKPFAELDHLYHQILLSHHDPDTLVRVLGTLVARYNPQPPEVTEDILDMEAGELSLVLRGLHSVIDYPRSLVDSLEWDTYYDQSLRFFHASFREYLVDHNRSGPFFIDEKISRAKAPFLVFELLGRSISQSYSEGLHRRLRPGTSEYLRRNLPSYFRSCVGEERHRLLDLINRPIQDLWEMDTYQKIQLPALHCAMTFVTVQISLARKSVDSTQSDRHLFGVVPYNLSDQPLEEREWTGEADKAIDQRLVEIFKKLCSILDRYYDLLLSKSPQFDEFLLAVPGFIAIENGVPTAGLAEILDVDVGILESYIERNKCFMISQRHGTTFDPHFVDYLCNRRRSGARHHDKRVDYIFLCKRLDRYISKERTWESSLLRYFDDDFPMSSIVIFATDSADHPLWTFLDYLEEDPFYPIYHPGLPRAELTRVRNRAVTILDWIQRQQQRITAMNTSLHVNFERKLDALVDKIYRQVLHVESTVEGPVITFCSPTIAAVKYNLMPMMRTSTPQNLPPFIIPPVHEMASNITEPPGPRLSQDIILLHEVFSTLQQYITSPSRAQGMYISTDAFHTQLAELLLPVPSLVWNPFWRITCSHLIRASATQKIYAGLRVSMLWPLNEYDLNHIQGFSQVVITWMERLDTKPPLDIYLGYQLSLLRAEAAMAEAAEAASAVIASRNNDPRVDQNEKSTIPSKTSDAPEPERETQLAAATDSTAPILALPTTKPWWKSVLEGIGDEYLRLGFCVVLASTISSTDNFLLSLSYFAFFFAVVVVFY